MGVARPYRDGVIAMAAREAEGGESGGDLMAVAELRPVLMQSKRKPVSCAVGLTKDKQAVVLLDRKMKPRKLMAEFKSRAKGAGLELDMTSVRFGRVALQGEDGTVAFTVNKAAPKAMEVGLTRKLRPAGVRKVEIGVDAKLEDEDDTEDGQDGASTVNGAVGAGGRARGGEGAGAGGGAASPGAATGPGVTDGPGTAAGVGASAVPGGGGAAAQGGPAGDNGATGLDAGAAEGAGAAVRGTPDVQAGFTREDQGGPAGNSVTGEPDSPADAGAGAPPGKATVARRLAGLVQRMAAALPGNPPGAAEMRAAAVAGQAAVKSGDMAGARQAADTLERLLGGTDDQQNAGGPGTASGGSRADASMPNAAGNQPDDANAAVTGGAGGAGRATPGSAAAPSTKPDGTDPANARPGPASPVVAKGRQAWLAVRTKLEKDINAVVGEVRKHFGEHGDEADLVRTSYEPIMHELDDSLLGKLDELAGAANPAARGQLALEAQAIIARYKAFADGNDIVTLLDENPFHPAPIRKTLDQALAALSQAVQAGGGRGGGGA